MAWYSLEYLINIWFHYLQRQGNSGVVDELSRDLRSVRTMKALIRIILNEEQAEFLEGTWPKCNRSMKEVVVKALIHDLQ